MSLGRSGLRDEVSVVDAHFKLKCVPAALSDANAVGSLGKTSNLVLVEDRRGCAGTGRVVLQHIVRQLVKSARTKHFVHVHLETDDAYCDDAADANASSHHHSSYAGDMGGWFATDKAMSLLDRIQADVATQARGLSSTAVVVVVVIDSLSALLEQFSLKAVSLFLTQLQQLPQVVAVATRFNASLHKPAVAWGLRSMAKTLVSVETAESIAAYPVLSAEGKRRIPVGMHGMVTLIRKLSNGQTTDAIEFFARQEGDASWAMYPRQVAEQRAHVLTQTPATPTSNDASQDTPLGALLSDLTFNLNVTPRDEESRKQVVLPYQHQGKAPPPPSSGGGPLFYIDDDDPDWDDDDLDDDLDI